MSDLPTLVVDISALYDNKNIATFSAKEELLYLKSISTVKFLFDFSHADDSQAN